MAKRKEAGVFCLGSDSCVVHYRQRAGRGKISLFLKRRDKVYPMYLALLLVRPFSSRYSWSYCTWDCWMRVADLLTILQHKAQDYIR